MTSIANTNGIIQQGAIGNAKVSVEVSKHIIKSSITKQEESKEAYHYVYT